MRPLALILVLFLASFLLPILVAHASTGSSPAKPLQLLYVGGPDDAAFRGVEQGVAEANVLGEFTGNTWAVRIQAIGLRDSSEEVPVAVFTSAQGAELERLAEQFEGVAVFNLSDSGDGLRRRCRTNLLHAAPSSSMKAAALAQWRSQHSQAPASLVARAWHGDFVKFAARDLNRRYLEAHGESMGDEAWSGWAAVKMVIEAVTRGSRGEPAAVLAALRDGFEFDGQKGVPLSLRATGQLRQPLLLEVEGRLLGEAPVRGVADLEELDSLAPLSCSSTEEDSK